MEYYVISPNIFNDGDNYSEQMFKNGVVEVGWAKNDNKGIFFSNIQSGDCVIVAQRQNWKWNYFFLGIVGDDVNPPVGNLAKKLATKISLEGIDLHFENWTANGSIQIPSPQRLKINENIEIIKEINRILYMNQYIKILQNNHNLILTGAPGTGKTYLAKEIAKAMGCTDDEIGFVQFHPSYDYTDFVEGLRPIQDGNGTVGFKRTDGVFKEFCKKALENWTEYENFRKMPKTEIDESKKTQEVLLQYFDYIENQLISQDGGMIDFLSAMKIRRIIRNKKGDPASIEIATSLDATTKQNLSVNVFCRDYIDFKNKKILSYRDVKPTYESTRSYHGSAYYYFRLYELVAEFERSKNFDKSRLNDKQDCEVKLKNFVFIIDEINRGEISKIFGELFFSIDPSYRGVDENGKPKGLVQTQYQNLVEDDDDFKKGFFVPENVYIVGTMNDIDRSVESMDFAFRRRFAFKEIKADKKNIGMLDELGGLKDKAEKKMSALNEAISKIPGLNSAYHIGGAYFLKLKNYDNDFNELWDNHLDGLLREYLRGRRQEEIEKEMKNLKQAYDSAN